MEPTTTPKHSLTTPNASERANQPRAIQWIGGVVRPRGFRHRGKPMRVAVWIDRAGSIVSAAIVEGHGPSVLRELLEEQLAQTEAAKRPSELVVWPNVRAAFRGLEYPAVVVEHDAFLTVVVEDQADFGRIPGTLPVRVGCS
ncbi:hypothetical protein ENSA5_10230 [Enhygromyxa salina]|uniref:Uncharacterized protein n=1 Tax=Enhygromyxa salina TaxID=215803 RepID=A0A2S9YGE7_9BACT|nr:hypothetical protein [Enhygromyxa salina]PRQ04185.1 hypothetical protein ENSA5_10230 [Enhygromyxa salina]